MASECWWRREPLDWRCLRLSLHPSVLPVKVKRPMGRIRFVLLSFALTAAQAAHAATDAPLSLTLDVSKGGGSLAGPLKIVALMTVLALLPAVVIAMTSF